MSEISKFQARNTVINTLARLEAKIASMSAELGTMLQTLANAKATFSSDTYFSAELTTEADAIITKATAAKAELDK